MEICREWNIENLYVPKSLNNSGWSLTEHKFVLAKYEDRKIKKKYLKACFCDLLTCDYF